MTYIIKIAFNINSLKIHSTSTYMSNNFYLVYQVIIKLIK